MRFDSKIYSTSEFPQQKSSLVIFTVQIIRNNRYVYVAPFLGFSFNVRAEQIQCIDMYAVLVQIFPISLDYIYYFVVVLTIMLRCFLPIFDYFFSRQENTTEKRQLKISHPLPNTKTALSFP